MHQIIRGCFVGMVMSFAAGAGLRADELKPIAELTVAAGERDQSDAPVEFVLPKASASYPAMRLVETTDGKTTPVASQIDPQAGRLWWIAEGPIAAGAKRTYRLEAGAAAKAPEIAIIDSERSVEARHGDKPLLRYNKAHVEPPAGVNPKYGRSAHLHPVWTPSGAIVTDELPPDHLHQSGIFLAYTKTAFEGRDVDFWNLAGGKGRVRFKALNSTTSGPVFGQFRVEHEHVDLTAPGTNTEIGAQTGGKVALVETWDVRVWNVGWNAGYWLLDVSSKVRCPGDSPLRLPEYHYGGMAIRAARSWTPEHVKFSTSEGNDRIKGNHSRPRWCDVSGLIDSQAAGITIMTHPTNFRFPEPLRIHPTMPYLVYTPSFLGDWEIRPAAPHESRYRFVIHDGELPPKTLERLWRDYAEPLMATGN
jgi:Family of unknown function (DUF6807)